MFSKKNISFFGEMQEKYEIMNIEYVPENYCEEGLKINLKYKEIKINPVCPKCGEKNTIKHDYKEKTLKSGTINGVPIFYKMEHCRYKCKCCGKTFMESFEFLPFYKGITVEAENHIIGYVLKGTLICA